MNAQDEILKGLAQRFKLKKELDHFEQESRDIAASAKEFEEESYAPWTLASAQESSSIAFTHALRAEVLGGSKPEFSVWTISEKVATEPFCSPNW